MREIHNEERHQRGCDYCYDICFRYANENKYRRRLCPHDVCPYIELDNFTTYKEYMKATEGKGFSKLMFMLGL